MCHGGMASADRQSGCQRFSASVAPFDGDDCGRGAGLVGVALGATLGFGPDEALAGDCGGDGVALGAGVAPGTPGVVAARLSIPAFTSSA